MGKGPDSDVVPDRKRCTKPVAKADETEQVKADGETSGDIRLRLGKLEGFDASVSVRLYFGLVVGGAVMIYASLEVLRLLMGGQ